MVKAEGSLEEDMAGGIQEESEVAPLWESEVAPLWESEVAPPLEPEPLRVEEVTSLTLNVGNSAGTAGPEVSSPATPGCSAWGQRPSSSGFDPANDLVH
jgi:hypothetical protein